MKIKKWLLWSLSIAGLALWIPSPEADGVEVNSTYEIAHSKNSPPAGGSFVQHPDDKTISYFFVSKAVTQKNHSKQSPGLYISKDAGKSYKLICATFDFTKLFIHPDTGKLFAIIEDQWLAPHGGYLSISIAFKAVMSEDGTNWKDITGKQKHFGSLYGIFQDPDFPDRVCLQANSIRAYILQSKDKEYSDWIWINERSWRK